MSICLTPLAGGANAAVSERGRVEAPARTLADPTTRQRPRSETTAYAIHVKPLGAESQGRHNCAFYRAAARFYSRRIRERETQMAGERARLTTETRQVNSPACPRWLARTLRLKAYATRARFERWQHERRAYFRRLYEKWRCIHEHEGAWNANTGNGYFGGLQMTRWFQQTYGPEFYRRWGTADRWPVWAQLVTAERAWKQEGNYRQWGTAPMCGLPT